ncbi:MAG: hypothetical protein ACOXZO_04975 [Bacteroidales bacterium]|jgi:V/A-type H+-transporting ATPase subunit E
MQNKLQELTDKIYQEGITKGREESEKIIAEARAEAERIIKKAEDEAKEILSKTEKEAEELKENTQSELRIAFRNALNSLRQDVESMITAKIIDEPVSEVMSDNSFVARLIEIATDKMFLNDDIGGGSIMVPSEMAGEIEKILSNKAAKALSSGVVVCPVKSMEKGFEIIPQEGSYKIRVTESDFKNYIREFLRSKLVSLLFEQEN